MDLIARSSGGHNIVARPQAAPRWQPTATVDAAYVQVWWRYEGEPASAAKLVGPYQPDQDISFPYNPAIDKNVILSFISFSADGVPDVSNLEDAVSLTIIFQRETEAPTVEQVGESTPDTITLLIRGFTRFAVKRKVRIAEASAMTAGLIVEEFASADYQSQPLPDVLDIKRAISISSSSAGYFNLAPNVDPASNGFTKNGTGATGASGGGWQIDTQTASLNDVTYYAKSGWPALPFAGGFTFECLPPTVVSQEGAAPNLSCACAFDDGTHRFELRWSNTQVALNGGTNRTHSGLKARLVIAAGGATADLWIGGAKVETATASIASVSANMAFGDLAGADDANVTWKGLTYAQTAADVLLAQTIYVAISHSSGGAYGAESTPLEVTFANEGTETGGSVGDADLVPRDIVEL